MNVLVVDDDREIVDSIGIFLAGEGYKALKAYDGLEALDLLCNNEVHLIILDIMMPKLDGIKTLVKLRESRNIPVILLSAKSEDADKIFGLVAGADALELDGSFFLIPTTKAAPGDIILSDGGPCCVIESGKNSLRVFSYQRGTIEQMVPERHIFMGKTYCYAKIFSPLANMMKGKGGIGNAVKMMILSRMFSDKGSGCGMEANPMMLMLMAGGGGGLFKGMFDGAFDLNEEDDEDEKED